MKALKSICISGREVLPLIDGGRGINATNGQTAGAWAAAGAVGTFSGISADYIDDNGYYVPENVTSKSRKDRQRELIEYAVKGAISQAKIAHNLSGGNGRIHMNVLWESGGAQEIMKRVLEGAKDFIHGVVSGAGMPYKLGEIASSFEVYYYPIVSSARAFKALWLRSFKKFSDYFGGVVYEDPWRAGGHNGLSNSEDPNVIQAHYPRVLELRNLMRKLGISDEIPIIVAGAVWSLKDWQDWINNPELGAIAFQFGTRALLVKESPVGKSWREKLMSLKKGDIKLQTLSPTGFYSSAVNNNFLKKLLQRVEREISFAEEKTEEKTLKVDISSNKSVYVDSKEEENIRRYHEEGFTEMLRTPDDTIVFLTPEEKKQFKKDVAGCMGCLSVCRFSGWSQIHEGNNTGKNPDPRTFCIHKTLMEIGHDGDIEENLLFSGHLGYNFSTDPIYANGNIPSVAEFLEAIKKGY